MENNVVETVVQHELDWTEKIINSLMNLAMTRGIDIIQACIIAAIGFCLCRWIRRVVHRMLTRSSVEDSAVTFITEIVYFFGLIIVTLTALGTMGVSTTSLSAALGGIGLGVGLALKDKVSNVASGIYILAFKPFRVGDYITASGMSGTVTNIRIMYTELQTTGNQIIVIPNLTMTSAVITNYSRLPVRNVEFDLGVGYGTDLDACVALIKETLLGSPYVSGPDAIAVYVKSLGDSAVIIYVRAGVAREVYFTAMNDLYILVKGALDKASIDIPYPQLVVHQAKE